MYDEILQQASEFDARFKTYNNPFGLMEVARDINQPHEDNHKRTPMTEELLHWCINLGDEFKINKSMVQTLHYRLFSGDLAESGIVAGFWRTHNVRVGNHIPPDAIHVDYLMECFFKDCMDLTARDMYRVFQTIHPFQDGNGRVGGILLAVRSYNELLGNPVENIIVPCQ